MSPHELQKVFLMTNTKTLAEKDDSEALTVFCKLVIVWLVKGFNEKVSVKAPKCLCD